MLPRDPHVGSAAPAARPEVVDLERGERAVPGRGAAHGVEAMADDADGERAAAGRRRPQAGPAVARRVVAQERRGLVVELRAPAVAADHVDAALVGGRGGVVEPDRHVGDAGPAVAPDVVALGGRRRGAGLALEAAHHVDEAADARGGDLGPGERRGGEAAPGGRGRVGGGSPRPVGAPAPARASRRSREAEQEREHRSGGEPHESSPTRRRASYSPAVREGGGRVRAARWGSFPRSLRTSPFSARRTRLR